MLLALVAVAFSMLFLFPQQAYAKSYSMPKVDIQAELTAAGDLKVVEQRTFDFEGDFTTVWWDLGDLPEEGGLQVKGVSITRIDGEGNPIEETTPLPEEPFVLTWRDSGGPSQSAYSVDASQNTVYVFFNASDEKCIVTFDYTVTKAVMVYKDVADLYWKYVLPYWEETSSDVSLDITLPMPEGVVLEGEDERVRAWGHGPLDGVIEINPEGVVHYSLPHVNSGQFAEARVVVPADWLTAFEALSVAEEDRLEETHLPRVLQEEQAWVDEANRTRAVALGFVVACCLVAVLLLVWAIRSYFKYGKEYEPDFLDQYWRDVPSSQDHPAVIARLWRWNKESSSDFTATLMHLSQAGAITISKGSYEKPGVFNDKTVDDYYLTRVPSGEAALTSPIDKKAMEFLFDTIADGKDSLRFGSIQLYGEENAQKFVDEMSAWQGVVSGETNKRDFFEFKSQRMQMIMVVAAIVFLVVGVAVSFLTENFIPLFFVVPVTIVLFVIANYMPRRSREGNNLDAKSKALKNWLRDFSALDERPPTDVKVWGEFMVYAYIFGIAKQVIKDLEMKVPELFQEDTSVMSVGYVPWWFWYSASHGSGGNIIPSASDMFQTSVSNTAQTAQAAISAASDNFSSGGGFGGGFSGGGGGGFGGGGGGGAR